MKFNSALTTLATLTTLVNALPNNFNYQKRQFTNGTFPNATSSLGGGAGVDAQNTGLVTKTVVQTVVSTVSQLYTTYPVTNVFTETLVIPGNGAGVAAVPTGAGTAPGSSPNSPGVVVVPGTTPGSGTGAGSGSGTGAGSGTVSGTGSGTGAGSGAGTGAGSACVCSVPVVVATGIYTVVVENTINLGSTVYTTAYPTTTLGVFSVSAGTIVPAVATVTNSAVIAQNTNAALAPGQSYQTVTIPGTSTTVVLIVTVITDVVSPVPGANNGGNGVGAQPNFASTSSAPYSNSSTTSTGLNGAASVDANGLTRSSVFPTASASATQSVAAVGEPVSATGPVVTSAAPAATSTAAAAASPAPGTQNTQVGTLGTTPLYNQQAFINDILNYHNTLRARNNAPAMTWNSDLATFALNNTNTNAKDGTFLHSSQMGINNPYGENIAYQSGQNNPEYLVWLWYEENTSYNYSNPVFSSSTGHFTQLVWDASTELGCAYSQATDSAGTYYLACEYSPPGNYAGEFSQNVNEPVVSGQPAQPAKTI